MEPLELAGWSMRLREASLAATARPRSAMTARTVVKLTRWLRTMHPITSAACPAKISESTSRCEKDMCSASLLDGVSAAVFGSFFASGSSAGASHEMPADMAELMKILAIVVAPPQALRMFRFRTLCSVQFPSTPSSNKIASNRGSPCLISFRTGAASGSGGPPL